MDSKPNIIEEKAIPMYELKASIAKIKKRDGDLNFRSLKTEEYLNTFVTLGPKKIKELQKEIEELGIPRLKPDHIYKIIDIMPADLDSLKLVLQGFIVSISQDNMKKIVVVIKKYL